MARLIVMALVLALSLAGCNTVEGLGNDISAGARTVKNTF